QWLKKMAVIKQNQSDEALLEEARERVLSGQSLLLSEQYRVMAETLAEECNCSLVPVETSGTERLLTGKIVKRLRPVNVDIHIKAPVKMSDYAQKRA
ncbi:lysophospholipid acyltransferase family protein, partial [Bacillus altitudinis]